MADALPQAPADAQPDGRIRLLDFAWIAAQLGLVLLLLRQYQIENSGFLQLAQFAFAGFLIHAFLPLRFRLPFFAVLSVAGTALLMGAANFAWMFGIGAVLVGICHLPLPFRVRGALLILAGGVLALQRAGNLPSPWSEAIWPILGSMFMFRLIVYFHDLRHDEPPATLPRTVSYFFMLPNASFPLFPVVDYKSFRRNYFDDDAHRIYQVGVNWIVRGIMHLILYRLVYYHMTLAPAEVVSPATFVQYILANFLLYLKVSGLFHLIVGMLYLFGFRLPETHNKYLLSAGFSDLWRRINIYWKDFMQKVFYYPAVFRFKRLGTTKAIVLATMWVFLMTWFLHAYQWFWIRGTSLFILQDILFWAILGVLVIVNSLYEIKHDRKRRLGKPKFSWRAIGLVTLKSYATFWFICLLWSFWTSEKVDDWLSLWRAFAGDYTTEALLWPAASFAIMFVGNIPAPDSGADPASERRRWLRERAVTIALAVLLVGLTLEPVYTRMGAQVSTAMNSLRHGNLSRLDAAKLERGYYEGLTDVTRFNLQLWETYAKRPANWLDNQGAGLKRFVEGFAQTEMIPSFAYTTTYGTITTNRWGMRDQDYAPQPAPGTFRVAILGSSSVMGWGVPDGATFESLVEARLNAEFRGQPFEKYELLNFGVQGYQPPQQLVNYERALALHPNAVMYIATGRELTRAAAYLAEVVHKRIEIPYAPLREITAKAGVTPGMKEVEAQSRLAPLRSEILAFVYGRIASHAKDHHMQALWVFLPQIRGGLWQEETEETVRIAAGAGFTVIRLDDAFKDQDVAKIRLAEWDDHPNTFGHQLIANHLFEHLRAERSRIFSADAGSAPAVESSQASREKTP